MNRMHLKNLLKLLQLSNFLLIVVIVFVLSGCFSKPNKPLVFNPLPLSSGQWVEYIYPDTPYDSFHIRFLLLHINEKGISIETDYITYEETLKIVSFHNIENNYGIDTFLVQHNSSRPYKFVPPDGAFIFDSPIPNLFIWSQHIDSTDWKTIMCNNKQFNVFPIVVNNDSIFYSSEIPVFNIVKMYINDKLLNIYNYGNKGEKSYILGKPEILITGKNLPEELKRFIEP